MDFKQLQEEFRKLEEEAGEKTSDALVSIMELRATQFEKDVQAMGEKFGNKFDAMDEKFESKFDAMENKFSTMQWMITLGFSLLGILMVFLKIF